MSYQGPPSWQVPPPGGWPQQQPQWHGQQWQPQQPQWKPPPKNPILVAAAIAGVVVLGGMCVYFGETSPAPATPTAVVAPSPMAAPEMPVPRAQILPSILPDGCFRQSSRSASNNDENRSSYLYYIERALRRVTRGRAMGGNGGGPSLVLDNMPACDSATLHRVLQNDAAETDVRYMCGALGYHAIYCRSPRGNATINLRDCQCPTYDYRDCQCAY